MATGYTHEEETRGLVQSTASQQQELACANN